MKPNELKRLWQRGETAINAWLHIPNTWSAEVMASLDWDSVTVDLQHGLSDLGDAIKIIQVISNMGVTPLARVTWNDPAQIMRLLDAGAYGIICPTINTREEAEAFVGACRYAPKGYRSLGPTRAKLFAGPDYAKHANDEILTFAMVETQQGLDNLDAIASVEGLDAIHIGPGDLKLSLTGQGGLDPVDDAFMAVLDRILAATKANGLVCGIHANSVEYARMMRDKGLQFITLQTDTVLLRNAAMKALADVRQ